MIKKKNCTSVDRLKLASYCVRVKMFKTVNYCYEL